jgi:uncharacterized protein YjiK
MRSTTKRTSSVRFSLFFCFLLYLAQSLQAQGPALRINAAGVVLRPDGGASGLSLVGTEIRGNGAFLENVLHYEPRNYDIRGMTQSLSTALAGLTGISGATYNARSGTLFVVENAVGAGNCYEISREGVILRTIVNSNFEDTEAIEWIQYDPATGSDVFLIAEENPHQRLTLCRLTPLATTLNRTASDNISATTAYNGGALTNLGLESACYDAKRGVIYYTAEKRTGSAPNTEGTTNAAIYQRTVIPTGTLAFGSESLLCTILSLYGGILTDISDMCFDHNRDNLLLLSDESNKIVRISRAGTVLEEFPITGATQPEGLTLHPLSQQLWITSEPNEFFRYQIGSDNILSISDGITLRETPATPANPAAGTEGKIYVKGDKLVISYNDGGTLKFRVLELTGTDATWSYTTTAP